MRNQIDAATRAGVRAVTVGAEVSAGAAAAAVVKVQDTVVNGLLARSRTAVAPPVSVAVYWVPAARSAVGSSVATRVPAL